MKRLLPILGMCVAAALSGAQTVSDYMAMRSKLGVKAPATPQALQKLRGPSVVELQGKVKGTLKVEDHVTLFFERPDGDMLAIESGDVPAWLESSEVAARLLVRAERLTENGDIKARLIGAAPEADVARHEATAKPDAAKKPPAKTSSRPVFNPLHGSIGRGGKSDRPSAQPKEWILPASEATPYYAGFIKQRNRRLSDAEATRIAQGVIGFSIKYGVDARLIMAMVMAESGFNPRATSRAGAQGLGQLMPGTAKGLGISNPYDSISNLYGTVRIVRGHLENYKAKTGDDYRSLVLTLAAYNAGSGAVKKHGGVPPYKETRGYIDKVISYYRALCGY
jgi:soluble lytic murein transglycosylase-like protein